ncbi:coiled-coil domain-containing protein 7-like, partial [Hyaena hyaena]|uniref:coiled-coil domain-containing protein 7-like n=1 Tax=Hyaena hyaena TaxID=95912 RepID=UPI0019235C75
TNVEHLTYNVGREKVIDEIKTQHKSHPVAHLLRNRYMSTQDQENIFTSHIAPHKSSTNKTHFSSFNNQCMSSFEDKNTFPHHQDSLMKNTTMSKFPIKVINLSPFGNLGRSEYISPHVTKTPKAYHKTSRAGSTIHKTIQFPSLTKEPSGHRKNSISNKKNVELTLPAVISPTKKTIHKVSYTAARKTLPHHVF